MRWLLLLLPFLVLACDLVPVEPPSSTLTPLPTPGWVSTTLPAPTTTIEGPAGEWARWSPEFKRAICAQWFINYADVLRYVDESEDDWDEWVPILSEGCLSPP